MVEAMFIFFLFIALSRVISIVARVKQGKKSLWGSDRCCDLGSVFEYD